VAGETCGKSDPLENPGLFEEIILKRMENIKEICSECVDWTDLSEDRD
jgi:hypothetical protein